MANTEGRGRGAATGNNQSALEKWAPIAGGAALALLGLSRRSKSGLAVAAIGGAVAFAGYKASQPRDLDASATLTLNTTPEDAYRFWRNFEIFPQFMKHLERVTVQSDRRSRWSAIGPLGTRVEWTAEVTSEREGRSLSWRSLPGSDIDMEGSVEFSPATGNRGTTVRVRMRYSAPNTPVGATFAKLLGKDPGFLMQQDMRRMKALIETGEVPTTQGQSHGPRDRATGVIRMIDPDEPLTRERPVTEIFQGMRRSS
jgi:uncharacterized membrane protein